MGLFRRSKPETPGEGKTIIAASIPLAGPDKVRVGRNFKPGSEDWQKEGWYFYDSIGEFHSAVSWIANAVSKAEVHAAEVDETTGQPGDPTENDVVQQIANGVLGGPEVRPGLLRMIAIQWQVPGESFVIVRSMGTEKPDEWMALSGSRVTYRGDTWTYVDPRTLSVVTLTDNDSLLIRVWSPHPNDPVKSDSATRSALPDLREIEKASQAIAAILDSRLATAGVQAVPSEASIPGDGSTAENLTDALLDAAADNIKNPGQSAARVPLMIEMPGEMIAAFAAGRIDYATQFDAAVVELRREALGRLAAALDMPNETAEGSTGGMNHWGAWQVEETTYKIYIKPLLDAIGDALTRDWFRPALKAAGVATPEKYVLSWDTSGIISRPDRSGELKELWDDLLISDDYRRTQAGIPDDAIPSDEEFRQRLLVQLVKASPAILSEGVGTELGIEIEVPEPEPAPVRALPVAPEDDSEPENGPPEGLVAAAEFAVFDALSRAGKRLLTREHRGRFGHVKAEELYLNIPHDRLASDLLEGSFAFIDGVAQAYNKPDLCRALTSYAEYLLTSKQPYRRDLLRAHL